MCRKCVVSVIVTLMVISSCDCAPSIRTDFMKSRLNRLERKVFEESIEFRNELSHLEDRIETIQRNSKGLDDTCNTTCSTEQAVDGSLEDQKTSERASSPGLFDSPMRRENLLVGFKDEKRYVREAIKTNENILKDFMLKQINILEGYNSYLKNLMNEVIDTVKQLQPTIEKGHDGIHREILQSHEDFVKTLTRVLENRTAEIIYNALSQTKEGFASQIDSHFITLDRKIKELGNTVEKLPRRTCGTWARLVNSCYNVFTQVVSWQQAKQKCFEQDAFLAEIGNENEESFLRDLVKGINSNTLHLGPWIGASDNDSEGTWVWAKSGEVISEKFCKWGSNEPNGGTKENCLHMFKSYNFLLNDMSCSAKTTYICEYEIY